MDFLKSFKAAHSVSTPLVTVRTFDNKSTIDRIKASFKADEIKSLLWDCVKGLTAYTETGLNVLNSAVQKAGTAIEATANLSEALRVASFLPGDVILFVSNAHMFWTEPVNIQGVWNLRDPYKAKGNMLVLLTSAGAILPAELQNDFLVLDEPLPIASELAKIITDAFKAAKLPEPSTDTVNEATRALIGLPAFPADQSTAMCLDLDKKALDINGLWERKKQAINQTRGLQVLETSASLESIGGLDSIKKYLDRVMNGKDAPNVILFLDEVEKAFAGTGTDMSGVKTALTGSMLQWTQDTGMRGIIELGLPGVGKSEIAKAIGNRYGKPVIAFNIPDMESGIIGSSNEHLRQAQAIIDAVSDKKVFAVATCNKIDSLPPELRRRFAEAIFFFDAPNETERASIWQVYREKYQIPETEPVPENDGWTGAEIKECVLKAYRLGITLKEASEYIIPVTISSSDSIEALRRSSSGKYLSATYPGMYKYTGTVYSQPAEMVEETTGRRMR